MTNEEAIWRVKDVWATCLEHLRETPKSFDDMIEIEKYHKAVKMAIAALHTASNGQYGNEVRLIVIDEGVSE